VADLLQVTIAFVMKIFSFSDRDKVLGGAFDTVGLQHKCVKQVTRGPNVVCDA